jgi:serine/threonine-protein kinase
MATPDPVRLGRYDITGVLGKGAMGVVYEGFDPRLNRRVAIKTILKSHLDEQTAKTHSLRFVREAQAVAKLSHPHIVQVHDFGEEGDIAYLVMEFIKGKELKRFFDANERFDLKEAVRIMCELCDALDFAHQAGIVHRDVKPANVMLDSQMRTKLTDFGVARVQDPAAAPMTQAGTMVGTPAYMSPEQITGRPVDGRSDVFSAGIVLYQLLTGEVPFPGAGAWTVAKKIMQEEPALPSTIDTAISPLFDAVVNKALAKNPDQRYPSARALGTALRRAFEGKADQAAEETVLQLPRKPAAEPPKPSAQDADVEFWRAIQDSSDPSEFEFYLRKFPGGVYAELATHKLAKLQATVVKTLHEGGSTSAVSAANRSRTLVKSAAIGAAVAAIGVVGWFIWKPMATEKWATPIPPAANAEVANAATKSIAPQERAEPAPAEKTAAKRTLAAPATSQRGDKHSASEAALAGDDYYSKRMWADAAREYRIAAKQNHPQAQRRLGWLYAQGLGVEKSEEQALRWYRKAAEQNDAAAQENIGLFYQEGRAGLAVDYPEALRWFRKAAVQNDPAAQNSIGLFYQLGRAGLAVDYQEAMRWYRKAAEQGDPLAQANVGYMYQEALGVARSYDEALRWYRKAAEQHNSFALRNIGVYYENGWGGLPRDLAEARNWYKEAASRGDAAAKQSLVRLGGAP